MQLDLFEDGLVTRLRNALSDALEQRDRPRAQAAYTALKAEAPDDTLLGPAACLIDHLSTGHCSFNEPPFDVLSIGDSLAGPVTADLSIAARRHLEETVAPAARAVLGDRALPWLRPAWRALAERAAGLPWDATQADGHPAALWLQAGDPVEAVAAVERIASWRRIPVPLAWMAQACCKSAGVDASWPLIAELCWLAPTRLPALVTAVADPLLGRLYRQFEDGFDDGPAWFPAWLLTSHPALLPRLREARAGLDTGPERGCRLLMALLGLERQGRHAEAIEHRRRLRDLHPALFAACMAAR